MGKKSVVAIIVGLSFITIGTLVTIFYARGFRPDTKNGGLKTTGLLVATSQPDAAQVYLNAKLVTATNNTLNLDPGEYEVTISKPGYHSWKKKLVIEKELVTKTDAFLFPSVPGLKPLTTTGAVNPLFSPDGSKIVYFVPEATASAEKQESSQRKTSSLTEKEAAVAEKQPSAGLYILSLSERMPIFSQNIRQISKNTAGFDWSRAKLIWSADSRQLLAIFSEGDSLTASQKKRNAVSVFLLETDRLNINPADISATYKELFNVWQEQIKTLQKRRILGTFDPFWQIASQSAKILAFSPDETKLFYEATDSAVLAEQLIPPLAASNTQFQSRKLEKGKIYVYDAKEDRNFFIIDEKEIADVGDAKFSDLELGISETPGLLWLPSSRYLLIISKNKIEITEYDGTNRFVFYAGPFENVWAGVWPDGSRLIILTNINRDSPLPANLYTINLR